MDVPDLEKRVARLDAALKPIATRPIDTSDPDWIAKMRASDPIREAGLSKADTVPVLRALLDRYADGDDDTRTAIRGMFDRFSSFRWAVHLPTEPTAESYRLQLLHFSARDQGADTRDEMLGLSDLLNSARSDGIDIDPILIEVAALSSDVDKYGMGSTRELLRRCAPWPS